MANKQAWKDYAQIVGMIEQSESAVIQLANYIKRLNNDKVAIFDNAARKAELKKIIDIHPDHTIMNLADRFTKLKDLLTHMESNEYI